MLKKDNESKATKRIMEGREVDGTFEVPKEVTRMKKVLRRAARARVPRKAARARVVSRQVDRTIEVPREFTRTRKFPRRAIRTRVLRAASGVREVTKVRDVTKDERYRKRETSR